MTPQDAIKWADGKMLELVHEYKIATKEAHQNRLDKEYAALTVLKSCAESRVPTTPTYKPKKTDIITTNYECPVCGCRRLGTGQLVAYCPDCGQCLDWRTV